MNHIAAEPMQVYALGHYAARDQHFGKKGAVEGQHEALASFLPGSAVDQPNVWKQALGNTILQLVFTQGGNCFTSGDRARLHTVNRCEIALTLKLAAANFEKLEEISENPFQAKS